MLKLFLLKKKHSLLIINGISQVKFRFTLSAFVSCLSSYFFYWSASQTQGMQFTMPQLPKVDMTFQAPGGCQERSWRQNNLTLQLNMVNNLITVNFKTFFTFLNTLWLKYDLLYLLSLIGSLFELFRGELKLP